MSGLPLGVDQVVFDDLKKDYDARKVVVFAGAGVSAAAGLPTWKGLAQALADRMREAKKRQETIDEVEDLIQRGDLVNAMSAARAALRTEFDRVLQKRLDDTGHDVPDVVAAIAALGPKLAGVVTTNLDRLLERAFAGTWPAIVTPVADLVQRERYIFKPHGTIENADGWVFTREEYDQCMFGSQALQDLFWALYAGRTLLFVGASLTDDDFGLTLGRVRARASRNLPTHYAILPEPVRPMRRDHLEKAGIRLLAYENRSGTHGEVVEILQALAGAAGGTTKNAGGPGGSTHPPTFAASAKAGPGAGASSGATPSARAPVGAGPSAGGARGSGVAGALGVTDLFISACPKDQKLRDQLLAQLSPLEKTGQVRAAHEGLVRPGEERKKVLTSYFDRARIVLLLLSADYLASDEHVAELKRALERSRRGTAVVIPVLLRAALWQDFFVGHELKPVPEKAVTAFASADDAFLQVVQAVKSHLQPA